MNKIANYIAMLLLSMLILAYSTILQFSMPSVILCFGEDGHIAFEPSDENNQCVDVDDDFILPVNNCSDLSDHKDDCQDVPLKNIISAFYLEKNTKIKIAKSVVFDETVSTTVVNPISQFDINNEFSIIHSSMKSLRTTILII